MNLGVCVSSVVDDTYIQNAKNEIVRTSCGLERVYTHGKGRRREMGSLFPSRPIYVQHRDICSIDVKRIFFVGMLVCLFLSK